MGRIEAATRLRHAFAEIPVSRRGAARIETNDSFVRATFPIGRERAQKSVTGGCADLPDRQRSQAWDKVPTHDSLVLIPCLPPDSSARTLQRLR